MKVEGLEIDLSVGGMGELFDDIAHRVMFVVYVFAFPGNWVYAIVYDYMRVTRASVTTRDEFVNELNFFEKWSVR